MFDSVMGIALFFAVSSFGLNLGFYLWELRRLTRRRSDVPLFNLATSAAVVILFAIIAIAQGVL